MATLEEYQSVLDQLGSRLSESSGNAMSMAQRIRDALRQVYDYNKDLISAASDARAEYNNTISQYRNNNDTLYKADPIRAEAGLSAQLSPIAARSETMANYQKSREGSITDKANALAGIYAGEQDKLKLEYQLAQDAYNREYQKQQDAEQLALQKEQLRRSGGSGKTANDLVTQEWDNLMARATADLDPLDPSYSQIVKDRIWNQLMQGNYQPNGVDKEQLWSLWHGNYDLYNSPSSAEEQYTEPSTVSARAGSRGGISQFDSSVDTLGKYLTPAATLGANPDNSLVTLGGAIPDVINYIRYGKRGY